MGFQAVTPAESLNQTLVMAAVEDLMERLDLIREVLIPDYLDEISEADWDLLVSLRRVKNTINVIALEVAQANKDMIIDRWVGEPTETPPPGDDIGPVPGG